MRNTCLVHSHLMMWRWIWCSFLSIFPVAFSISVTLYVGVAACFQMDKDFNANRFLLELNACFYQCIWKREHISLVKNYPFVIWLFSVYIKYVWFLFICFRIPLPHTYCAIRFYRLIIILIMSGWMIDDKRH